MKEHNNLKRPTAFIELYIEELEDRVAPAVAEFVITQHIDVASAKL